MRVANLACHPVTFYRGQGIGNFYPLAAPDDECPDGAYYQELPSPVTCSYTAGQVEESAAQGIQGTTPAGEIEASLLRNIEIESLDTSQLQQLQELIGEFRDVFSTGKHDLGRTHQVHHRINTGDASPIRQGPRRVPIHYREEVGRLIEEMQTQKVIQPSQSPWASPLSL